MVTISSAKYGPYEIATYNCIPAASTPTSSPKIIRARRAIGRTAGAVAKKNVISSIGPAINS